MPKTYYHLLIIKIEFKNYNKNYIVNKIITIIIQ